MTFHEYIVGKAIASECPPFYGLIQAAMRGADSNNLDVLKRAWPGVWKELEERYNSLGGKLAIEWEADQQS